MTNKKHKNKKIIIISLISIIVLIVFMFFNKTKSFNFTSLVTKYLTGSSLDAREKYNFNYDWKFAYGEGVYDSGSDFTHYCKIIDHNDCIDAKTSPSSEYEIVNSYSGISESDAVYNNSYDIDNDSRFSDVSLPHTYNEEDSFDNYNEGAQNGNRSTYSGTGWYKKEFFAPESYRDKKVYIEFEAARQAMEIYVNGTKLSEIYENGFIPVGYDLTPYINIGEINTITVKVDNTYPYFIKDALNNSTTSKVLWHNSHWHPNYGGLYRNSYLYVLDNLHLTLPLYSYIEGQGTYIYSNNVVTNENNNTSATINIDAEVENSSNISQTFYVKSIIYDMDGNQVSEVFSDDKVLSSGSKEIYHLNVNINNVKLWSTDYPYLYTVKTQIIKGNTIIDDNSDNIGIRTFRFTNDFGFYLNENYQELNGWGQKSTMEWAGLGSAYPDWMTDYVIKLMKDANANYIRWGHTSGSPKQIESCEKYGLLVTQPGVDGEGNSEGTYDANSAKLRIEALRDMIIYFRNSPSIIMWELGNHSNAGVTLNSTYIDSIKGLTTSKTSASMYELLYTIANQYDYGNRDSSSINSGTYDTSVTNSDRLLTIRRGNSVVANYVENEETTLGEIQINGKTYVEGEYNRLESPRRIWDNYTTGTALTSVATNRDYYKNSEDFAISQIKDMGMVTGQPGIVSKTGSVGGANWIFSDSESHARITKEVTRTSGEVDAVMLEKEAYYVDKVIFSKVPAIHVIGHWNYTNGTIKNVYVAARNVEYVELYVNDTKYIGTLSNNYLWTFNNVNYVSGTITAKGYDKLGNVIITDSITTTGLPDHILLTPIVGNEGLKANGSDILLIDAEVVDANGNRVVTYDGISSNDLTTFTINDESGTSKWRGGYNSSIENSTNNKSLYLEAGINRVSVRTTMNPGLITVSASTASGLTSNTISLNSTPIDNTNGVSELEETPIYNLSSITDPGYGNAEKLGIQANISIIGSTLVTNMGYSGSIHENNKISDAFGPGAKMYSDEEYTFTDVPYSFYNAEYLVLPNADKTSIAVDLINFVAKRDINVYIMHDPEITTPTWLNSYTKVPETIVGGNGIVYDIYMKSFNKNDLITIGGNENTSQITTTTVNQIVFFKETDKVSNKIFFEETFDEFDQESLDNSWNLSKVENTNILVDSEFNGNTIHLTDSVAGEMAYFQKSFVPLTGKFNISFKAYLNTYSSTNGNNSWLRFWLTDGKIANSDDKSNLGIESYINTEKSGYLYFNARNSDNSTGNTSMVTDFNLISPNNWHTYSIKVDLNTKSYNLSVDGIMGTTTYPLYISTLTSLNNFVVGTWKGGDSDFYIDDISILPLVDNVITNVKIDNNIIEEFNNSNEYYHIENINEDSILTFDTTEYYLTHSTSYDSVNKCIVLQVTDIHGVNYTYKFYNIDNSSLLKGWKITATENTRIETSNKDGIEAIHLIDNSSSEHAYIGKNIGEHTDKLMVSYDAYVTNLKENQYLRVWLGDGEIVGLSKTNVAISDYLYRLDTDLQFWYEHNYSSSSHSGINSALVTGYSLNTWNNIKFIIDIPNHSYDLYINNILAYSNIPFLINTDNIDYLVLGTGNSKTSDYYIKNVNVETIFTSPISGIQIDDCSVENFTKTNMEYDYYSADILNNDTNITVTADSIEYSSYSVEKDLIEQKATVIVTNTSEATFTYIINFKNLTEIEITRNMLQDLVTTVNNLTSTDYSNPSWELLNEYLVIANSVVLDDDATTTEIGQAYTNLFSAKNSLVLMHSYTDYLTSNFNNIRYSDDLTNKFDIANILQVGGLIYKNESSTFRSIPKKYINSEYFVVNNELTNRMGSFEFSFTTTSNMSLMLFRDYKSGEVPDNSFAFTGDIATSTDGTVYKIYKKDYVSGDNVSIDFKKYINNAITNKNSIIVIKNKLDIDNNRYIYEDFSKYSSTELFEKHWTVENDHPESNTIELQTKDGESALYIGGTSTTSAAWAYLRFADQMSGKFKIDYKFLADNTISSTYNGYTRVWINSNLVINQNTCESNMDKTNTLVESYIDYATKVGSLAVGKLKGMYRSASHASNTLLTNSILQTGTWLNASYTIDMDNNLWNSTIDTQTKTGLDFTNNLTPANILYLSSRKTGPTSMWFADIIIEPVEKGYITSLGITNTNTSETIELQDYTSTTSDYLYRSSDVTNIQRSIIEDDDDTTTVSETTTSDYTNVITTKNETTIQDNRIYYELNTDKYDLTLTINEALSLDSELYTITSWTNLETSLTTAINVLKDPLSTQSSINNSKNDLRDKIDNLILKGTINIYYSGSIKYGNNLNNSTPDTVYITNNSSITMNANMNILVGNDYPYKNTIHNRKLVSNTNLPINTKITMLDKVNNISYYYILTEELTEINLENFIELGTTDTHFINNSFYNNETGRETENFDFIIDFEDCDIPLIKGEYKIKLYSTIEEINVNMNDLTYFITDDLSTYTLGNSIPDRTFNGTETIPLTLVTNYMAPKYDSITATDTTKFDKEYSIRMTLYKNSTIINLPKGTTMSYEDNYSFVNENSCTLHLENLNTASRTVKLLLINFGNYELLDNGTYNIKLDLIESSNGIELGKIVATSNQSIEIIKEIRPSLKVELDNSTINVLKPNTESSLKYIITKQDTNNNVLLYLEKKNNNIFETIDIQSYINNSLNLYDDYTYNIGNIPNITLNFKNNLNSGTYRITYEILNNTDTTKRENYFVVKN